MPSQESWSGEPQAVDSIPEVRRPVLGRVLQPRCPDPLAIPRVRRPRGRGGHCHTCGRSATSGALNRNLRNEPSNCTDCSSVRLWTTPRAHWSDHAARARLRPGSVRSTSTRSGRWPRPPRRPPESVTARARAPHPLHQPAPTVQAERRVTGQHHPVSCLGLGLRNHQPPGGTEARECRRCSTAGPPSTSLCDSAYV